MVFLDEVPDGEGHDGRAQRLGKQQRLDERQEADQQRTTDEDQE